jgi:hypothetical protein
LECWPGSWPGSSCECSLRSVDLYTNELSGTELGTLPPLVIGGIIENKNSDLVIK